MSAAGNKWFSVTAEVTKFPWSDLMSVTGLKLAQVAAILDTITRPELEAWAAEQREHGLDPNKVEDWIKNVTCLGVEAARDNMAKFKARQTVLLAAVRTDKRFTTLQARAACAGGALEAIEGDDGRPFFILSVGGETHQGQGLLEIETRLLLIKRRS